MRFSRIFDGDGGYREEPANDPSSTGANAPSEGGAVPTGGGGTPEPAPAPTGGAKPGPIETPAPAGGSPAPQAPAVPPAVVSSVPGITGSETTGGVQGSFGQAGSSDFSKRFGLPAAWFKTGPTAGLGREAANAGRGVLGKGGAGSIGGGSEVVQNVQGPTAGLEAGGGKNDEEWQRILQAVMKQRFS